MSVWSMVPLPKTPAAVHEVVDTHETLERLSIVLAFGLGTTDQVVPSQDKTNVLDCVLVSYQPTAVHELVETQDTPASVLNGSAAVLGLGLGTTDQVVPSHISTRV